MPRPIRHRKIGHWPEYTSFKPAGIPGHQLEEVILNLDELEAVRLADFLGLYQDEAARHMNISRQTFGNLLNDAHHKIADCLITGKSLKIEGGEVELANPGYFCNSCAHQWSIVRATETPAVCPQCETPDIRPQPADPATENGPDHRPGRRRRWCHRGHS